MPIIILISAIIFSFAFKMESYEAYKNYSFYLLPAFLAINSLIYYTNFYNQVRKITSQTSIELLSYTNNLSRSKIYFNKLLAFLILNLIGNLLATIFLLLSLLIILKNNSTKEIFDISFIYFGISLFLSILFFGLFFLIDTFLVSKITKKHNLISIIIGIIFGVSLISTPILQSYGSQAAFQKREELTKTLGSLLADSYSLLKQKGEVDNLKLRFKIPSDVDINLEDYEKTIDKIINAENQTSNFYRNINIIRYFNIFNFFAEVLPFTSVKNEYFYEKKTSINSMSDGHFLYYYRINQIPQDFFDSFVKVNVKVNSSENSEPYLINILNLNIFSNLPYNTNLKWENSIFSYSNKNLNISQLKFGEVKKALNSLIENLKKDPNYQSKEVILNENLIQNIINSFYTNDLISKLLTQEEWEIFRKKINTNNDFDSKRKKDLINNMVESWAIYVIIQLAIEGNNVLVIDKDINNLNFKNWSSSLEKRVIKQLSFDMLIPLNNITVVGMEQTYYHLWISLTIILILLVAFNTIAFYRYRKVDIG
ncbi:hypothetical protein [Candidatus Mycoplasma pogonae]